MQVFSFEFNVLSLVALVLIVVKVWALIDAILRRSDAFVAASKLTRPAWLLILGLGLVCSVVFNSPIGLFSLVATVAAFVYLLDVRPALSELTRRR